MLAPVFEQASDIVKKEYPSGVVLGRVDCEAEQEIAQRFHITKYPILKIWRNVNSVVTRREYRGVRSVDAFSNYVREQMKSKVQEFHTLADLHVDPSKRNVIAYLESKDSANFNNFEKVAEEFREYCRFHFGVGDASVKERQTGDNIVFRPQNKGQEAELKYMGDLSNFDLLRTWVSDKCIPLVREITFENAEEITEEEIPFLLLFYHPDNKSSIELYKVVVSKLLKREKGSINFLIADGLKFSHSLQHLGKGPKDLPLIAIDSFKHMYLFPKFEDIKQPGKLQKFVADLHSGKLHREFHHGPDPEEQTETPNTDDAAAAETQTDNAGTETQAETEKPDSRGTGSGSGKKEQTTPPETVFKKLAPSYNRYTLLRDEL
ncbi:PREDICTED: endoplasmic reticulum resident protein 44-like [Acropora digitifera]|uniref:endoplasmic reticulum resident protein 44-like n=1 Tax=Acropora digitifera TaxID=70779 RepID=UPI00077A6D86|nr:PREDICTED: endoplasmic reticulum resident protein 44-like [Acropora digitifera]